MEADERERIKKGIEEWERKHKERLATDPEYRKRHEALVELSRIHQELHWPDEPKEITSE